MSKDSYFQDEDQVEDVGFCKKVEMVKDNDVEVLQMPDLCLKVVLGKN